MALSVFFLAVAATAFVGTYAERFAIDIGMRSYDGKMWFCNDGKDRKIPAKYATPASRKGATFADLPEGERPQMRKLKDGSMEADVLDDGNSWVAVVDSKGNRNAYLVSSDGFHGPVCTKTGGVPQVEGVSGKEYIVELPFKTNDMTLDQVTAVAKKVGGDKKIDAGSDDKDAYLYKGNDFVVDFVLALVDKTAQDYMRASANNWPLTIQLLDYDYYKKHGQSCFSKRKIDRGVVPKRSWLSRMMTINDKKFAIRAN
jgi:hypothetical protein